MATAGQLIEAWLPLTFAINSINRCVINKDASAQWLAIWVSAQAMNLEETRL